MKKLLLHFILLSFLSALCTYAQGANAVHNQHAMKCNNTSSLSIQTPPAYNESAWPTALVGHAYSLHQKQLLSPDIGHNLLHCKSCNNTRFPQARVSHHKLDAHNGNGRKPLFGILSKIEIVTGE